MKTDYDEAIGNINIVPQDVGRAVLNLITNAFYAVIEKQKTAGVDYEPTVWVSTEKIGDKVFISVKDNGNGIPQKYWIKCFNHFLQQNQQGKGQDWD